MLNSVSTVLRIDGVRGDSVQDTEGVSRNWTIPTISKWAMGPSGDPSDCVGLCTIAGARMGRLNDTYYFEMSYEVHIPYEC